MTRQSSGTSRQLTARGFFALALAFVLLPFLLPSVAAAQSGDRTLYLHYTHTNETARITFRRNGRYDQAGLNQLNQFLRDWRRNEPTKMDPALFDLIWTVYQEVGATQPVTVVSAYRSPATNDMLRSRSSGVAENSRHTMGMAMDFYIPGVPLSKLREVAMKHQVGGVGYYPTSGSPFVHLDTGNVRAWPRMTRAQLQRLFPNGRTLHLPSDGNSPLSAEGRRYAMAEWQRCKSVPCAGSSANTQVTTGGGGNGRNLLDLFLGTGGDEVDTVQVASSTARQNPAPSAPLIAPVPAVRSQFVEPVPLVAPIPVEMPQTIMIATRSVEPAEPLVDGLSGLAGINNSLDPISVASIAPADRPTPRALLSGRSSDLPLVASYAPTMEPEPDAQRALQMLIERRNSTGTQVAPQMPALRGSLQTASLGIAPQVSLDDAADFFASTWNAVRGVTPGSAQPAVEQLAASSTRPDYELINAPARTVQLYAPDLAHFTDTMVSPVTIANARFAVSFSTSETDLSPATELGVHCKSMTFSNRPDAISATDRFAAPRPVFVATL